MNTRASMACLAAALSMFAARADAIPFFGIYVQTNAVALTGDGLPGVDQQSSVTMGDTVTASAASVGAADVATAGAVAGPDLLTTTADVSAATFGSAVATAQFSGAFVNAGPVWLSLDFTPSSFSSGTGGGSTTLFVSLVSNGVSLFRDYVTGPWSISYSPVVGSTSLLDLTLSSEVNAAFSAASAGDASAFGIVSVVGTVPEASTWLMLALGLGAVGAVKSSARRKALDAA